ncbi:MAG TPA: hypothetical protein VGQ20_15005 [Acidimicrobiales bacterium]|nr:hypothetical protein [Acidimicrobiales bacterium]
MRAPIVSSRGQAWQWCRSGRADAGTFGVAGHTFGLPEVAGNAVRDLAALNTVEMLPWDCWGLMGDCYQGRTSEDYAAGLDELAAVTMSDKRRRRSPFTTGSRTIDPISRRPN